MSVGCTHRLLHTPHQQVVQVFVEGAGDVKVMDVSRMDSLADVKAKLEAKGAHVETLWTSTCRSPEEGKPLGLKARDTVYITTGRGRGGAPGARMYVYICVFM